MPSPDANKELLPLAPCPFCKSDNVVAHAMYRDFYVKCGDCEAMGPLSCNIPEAKKNWNTRPQAQGQWLTEDAFMKFIKENVNNVWIQEGKQVNQYQISMDYLPTLAKLFISKFSSEPVGREVKWPEKRIDKPYKWIVDGVKYETWDKEIKGWNDAIDACITAYNTSQEKEKLVELSDEEKKEIDDILQSVMNKEFSLDVSRYEVVVMRNEFIKLLNRFGTRRVDWDKVEEIIKLHSLSQVYLERHSAQEIDRVFADIKDLVNTLKTKLDSGEV